MTSDISSDISESPISRHLRTIEKTDAKRKATKERLMTCNSDNPASSNENNSATEEKSPEDASAEKSSLLYIVLERLLHEILDLPSRSHLHEENIKLKEENKKLTEEIAFNRNKLRKYEKEEILYEEVRALKKGVEKSESMLADLDSELSTVKEKISEVEATINMSTTNGNKSEEQNMQKFLQSLEKYKKEIEADAENIRFERKKMRNQLNALGETPLERSVNTAFEERKPVAIKSLPRSNSNNSPDMKPIKKTIPMKFSLTNRAIPTLKKETFFAETQIQFSPTTQSENSLGKENLINHHLRKSSQNSATSRNSEPLHSLNVTKNNRARTPLQSRKPSANSDPEQRLPDAYQ